MRTMHKKQRKEFSSLYIFFQRIRRLGNINGNRVPTKVFQIIMDNSTVSHYIPSCAVVIVFEKIYLYYIPIRVYISMHILLRD